MDMLYKDKKDLDTIKGTLKANEIALETHMDDIAEYKELVAKMNLLATKLTTINEIASDRMIWSFHLNTLARLAPDNLWYDTIEDTTRSITEEIQVLDPKTNTMVKRNIKRDVPVLKIKGFISADELGQTNINPFLDILDNDPDFSSMFQFEPPKLGYKEIDKIRMRTFELNCIISPSTSTGETE